MNSAGLQVAVISGSEAHHRFLVWKLISAGFDVTVWIVEPETTRRARAFQHGSLRDRSVAIYHLCRRRILGLDAYRRASFKLPEPLCVEENRVGSVNNSTARELLRNAPHDVTVVIGCSILRQETLKVAGEPTINVHGGFLPEYRGNHCIFFALYEEAVDKIGVSLHFVDEGVDTGDIIEVVQLDAGARESEEALYCRGEHLAFDALVGWLRFYADGGDLPRTPQPRIGRTYRARDRTVVHDLRHWARRFGAQRTS